MREHENADLAYTFEVEIGDSVWEVRRTLALVNRIEGRFGALDPLSRRLQASDLQVRELAHLLETIVADAPASMGPPKRDEIAEWIMRVGVAYASRQIALEMLLLVSGNEVIAEVLARKKQTAGRERARDPFAPTAASTGPIG